MDGSVEPLQIVLIAFIVVAAVGTTVFLLYKVMKVGKKKKEEPVEVVETEKWSTAKEHTITLEDAKKAQEELKTLDIEREIVSYAIRRLYEAHAEGKLTEEERDKLASGYKEKMAIIKDAMSRNESVVALHELESMQDDLTKLFNERFDELNTKIEDLKTRLNIEPIKEIPIPSETTPPEEVTPKKEKRKEAKPPTPAPKKTEAEERIEKIKEEVEKVLEKLGQIEAEA